MTNLRGWSALLVGAMLGAAATIYYMNNEQGMKTQYRRVRAKSRRVVDDLINGQDEDINEMLRGQG